MLKWLEITSRGFQCVQASAQRQPCTQCPSNSRCTVCDSTHALFPHSGPFSNVQDQLTIILNPFTPRSVTISLDLHAVPSIALYVFMPGRRRLSLSYLVLVSSDIILMLAIFHASRVPDAFRFSFICLFSRTLDGITYRRVWRIFQRYLKLKFLRIKPWLYGSAVNCLASRWCVV